MTNQNNTTKPNNIVDFINNIVKNKENKYLLSALFSSAQKFDNSVIDENIRNYFSHYTHTPYSSNKDILTIIDDIIKANTVPQQFSTLALNKIIKEYYTNIGNNNKSTVCITKIFNSITSNITIQKEEIPENNLPKTLKECNHQNKKFKTKNIYILIKKSSVNDFDIKIPIVINGKNTNNASYLLKKDNNNEYNFLDIATIQDIINNYKDTLKERRKKQKTNKEVFNEKTTFNSYTTLILNINKENKNIDNNLICSLQTLKDDLKKEGCIAEGEIIKLQDIEKAISNHINIKNDINYPKNENIEYNATLKKENNEFKLLLGASKQTKGIIFKSNNYNKLKYFCYKNKNKINTILELCKKPTKPPYPDIIENILKVYKNINCIIDLDKKNNNIDLSVIKNKIDEIVNRNYANATNFIKQLMIFEKEFFDERPTTLLKFNKNDTDKKKEDELTKLNEFININCKINSKLIKQTLTFETEFCDEGKTQPLTFEKEFNVTNTETNNKIDEFINNQFSNNNVKVIKFIKQTLSFEKESKKDFFYGYVDFKYKSLKIDDSTQKPILQSYLDNIDLEILLHKEKDDIRKNKKNKRKLNFNKLPELRNTALHFNQPMLLEDYPEVQKFVNLYANENKLTTIFSESYLSTIKDKSDFNKKCNTLQQLAKSIKAYTTVDTKLYAQPKQSR